MKALLVAISLTVAVAAPAVGHDGEKGTIENTVGPMGNAVLQARLARLGYTQVKIDKTNVLRYRVEALKDGKHLSFFFHPQTGEIVELDANAKPVRTWHMPTEPQVNGTAKRLLSQPVH